MPQPEALAEREKTLSRVSLQGFENQPILLVQDQDLEDIRALLRANRETLNLSEVREYFRLFDRERLLDDLLHETA